MRVNIIGGGLAGCSLAYVLKQRGHEPVIYEASSSLASGASGNDVGLYNPRFTAEHDKIGQFYSSAFQNALGVFEIFNDDIDWNPCGALHLMTDEKKERRFNKMVANWPWSSDDMRLVDAQEASDISGVDVLSDCLYLHKSGKISPKKMCAAYANGVEVVLNTPVPDVSMLGGDVVVLACGMGVLNFKEGAHLPLKAVRGQVSYIGQIKVSEKLRCTLGFGGYIAPAEGGVHCLGSTFQRWLDHSDIIPEDDISNISKLCDAVPSLAGDYEVVGHRAAVRTTSNDHFPVFGQLAEGLYVSTAHGSHGILSSLQAAIFLADQISKQT